jgi:hypothetical protein
VATGREAVQIILQLGEIPALTQAIISGAKNHQNNLADIERTERERERGARGAGGHEDKGVSKGELKLYCGGAKIFEKVEAQPHRS